MATYDDMPVGTALRDPSTGAIYLRVDDDLDPTIEWRQIFTDGSTVPTEPRWMPDWLVELVEKTTMPAAGTPKLTDRLGLSWIARDGLYHMPDCPDTCDKGVTREQLDKRYGPMRAVTA
jgi:hypothetical protein